MEKAKETIIKSFNNNERKYNDIFYYIIMKVNTMMYVQ